MNKQLIVFALLASTILIGFTVYITSEKKQDLDPSQFQNTDDYTKCAYIDYRTLSSGFEQVRVTNTCDYPVSFIFVVYHYMYSQTSCLGPGESALTDVVSVDQYKYNGISCNISK